MSVWDVQHFAAAFQQTIPSAFVVTGHKFDLTMQPVLDAIVFQIRDKFVVQAFRYSKDAEATSQDQ